MQKKKEIAVDMREMKPFATGIGNHYISLIHALIAQFPDYSYTLIINDRCEKYLKESFKDLSVKFVLVNINGGSFEQYLSFLKLYKLYDAMKYDLLITDIWSCLPKNPKPTLLMMYDLIGFHKLVPLSLKQNLFDTMLAKYIASQATGLIASSHAVESDIKHFFHIKQNKIHVIYPSVAKEYIEDLPDGEKIRAIYQLPEKYIVYVGNRRPHKNLLTALKIFSLVAAKHKSVCFVLIGGFDTEHPQEHDELQDAIQTQYRKLKDRIIFLGKVPSNTQVRAVLNGAICLLHPSLFEGFGLTPLEALYSQTCVVASNIPAIQEVVQDAALLVDPQNVEGFVNAVNCFIENPKQRSDYIEKGTIRAHEITWENAAYALETIIKNTCA